MGDGDRSRRQFVSGIAAGIAGVGLVGSSSGAPKTTKTSNTESKFEKLVRKHGKPRVVEYSAVTDGKVVRESANHRPYVDFLLQEGYSTGQVESLEFDDGRRAVVVGGNDGNDVVVLLDTSQRGPSSKGVVSSGGKNLHETRFTISQDRIDESLRYLNKLDVESNVATSRRSVNTSSYGSQAFASSSGVRRKIEEGSSFSTYNATEGWSEATGTENFLTAPAAATDEPDRGRVGASVNTRVLAYQAGGEAEVYSTYEFVDDGLVKVSPRGRIRGTVSAAIASASVDCSIFMRDPSTGNKKELKVIDIDDALEFNQIDESYDEYDTGPGGGYGPIYYSVDSGEKYEIGARIRIASTAFSTSSAVINFYPEFHFIDSEGYFGYSSLNIGYV